MEWVDFQAKEIEGGAIFLAKAGTLDNSQKSEFCLEGDRRMKTGDTQQYPLPPADLVKSSFFHSTDNQNIGFLEGKETENATEFQETW